CAIAAAIAAVAAPARAQSAEADVLFRDGKKLLKDGNVAAACEKLDASERLESSVGTLLNLADCRERNHQLATAWATFRKAVVAARNARDGRREKEARRREKLLAPRLSYLTVNVPEDGRVDGLAITRNGSELDRALWNQRVPVDAGDYELAATAEGYRRWTAQVRIEREAQKAEIEVPALVAEPRPAPEPAPRAPPVEDADDGPTRRAPTPPSRWTTSREIALGVAAAGAAGLGIAIGYGLHGRQLEQQSDVRCPTATCNDARGLSLNADARHAGRIANLGFAAGGGLLAGAIVVWWLGGPSVAPVVGRDQVGIALAGAL
ncbi:MAG TPA: hypothetical protein VHW23_13565, partial [Kofleriaceae bacterium]|nr:hypothetical protein [Kofleriaceae bacterium]